METQTKRRLSGNSTEADMTIEERRWRAIYAEGLGDLLHFNPVVNQRTDRWLGLLSKSFSLDIRAQRDSSMFVNCVLPD
jgi:hypothetical protein